MNKMYLGLAVLGSAAVIWGCGGKVEDDSGQTGTAKGMAAQTGQATGAGAIASGTVTETMNSGGYTYVLVDTGDKSVWVAAPEFSVEVGAVVTVPSGMPMPNYHSKTLDRTFDMVYFAESVQVQGQEGSAGASGGMQMPPGHPQMGTGTSAPPADVDLSGIEKAPGGMTVAEVYAQRNDLTGKEVTVRGKVVKSLSGIMGRNWIHIQDGTGAAGENDLTVTTAKPVEVGDLVLVKGVAAVDKDFGAGYFYPVILEEATVTVESE